MEKKKLINELLKYRYAHRGLHIKPEIAENSMTAFKRAVDMGFGIELDVHLTIDGKLAVIHDSSLKRTCGIDISIEEIKMERAKNFLLEKSEDVIPEFNQVLKLVDGKVPLIIELKATKNNYEKLTDKVMNALKEYDGMYCIESFNPLVVAYLRKGYPDVVRGQLAGALNKEKKTVTTFENFLLKNLLVNIKGKPDFVAYHFEDRNEEAFLRYKGAKFMWTIREYSDLKVCEGMGAVPIFEKFNPKEFE